MQVLHRRCAGIDVHKAFVVVCARIVVRTKATSEEARFETTPRDLLALAGWLAARKIEHIVMESTGVYWQPVWHILEGCALQPILANAQDVRNVPGRKSDSSDARWLSDLMAHGLVRASFVPPQPIRELRDLTRTRQQIQRQITQQHNRIAKVLETANIKLASQISDLLGASGRRILEALVGGETDPARLAALADRRIKASREQLADALQGRFTRHHAFLVRAHLDTIAHLEHQIAAFEREVDALLAPFQDLIKAMTAIPGVKRRSATGILAEIGTDMSIFPTVGHVMSWARMVPRLDESGGKTYSRRIKKGGSWLKPLLVQCAWAAARTRNTYLSKQFAAIASRRGAKKAAVAVGPSILTAIYFMIKRNEPYNPPAPSQMTAAAKAGKARHLASQIKALGFDITLAKAA